MVNKLFIIVYNLFIIGKYKEKNLEKEHVDK